jgi:hypothetical protein
VFDPGEGRAENWVAEVLNTDGVDQTMHMGPFPVPVEASLGNQLTNDLLGFYAWALPRCRPSDHIAVFFWGHSAGPLGLFEPKDHIQVPLHIEPITAPIEPAVHADIKPVLGDVTQTPAIPVMSMFNISQVLLKTRRARMKSLSHLSVDDLTYQILTASADLQVFDPIGNPVKTEIVLFQDCWMSTLETAFELKDAAHFVVASQSLVPFGRPSIPNKCHVTPTVPFAGVWKYDCLFDNLRHYDSNSPRVSLSRLVDTLGSFYQDSRNIWPNPSVPFALLDLDTINSGKPGAFDASSVKKLVCAIFRLMPGNSTTNKNLRGTFIEKASLAVAGAKICQGKHKSLATELAAGSIALVDFTTLCSLLSADPRLTTDERDAIQGLIGSQLVVTCKESIYRSAGTVPPDDPQYSFQITRPDDSDNTPASLTQALGFRGVSALYYPTPARRAIWGNRDHDLTDAVRLFDSFYDGLKLSTETNWGQLALEQVPEG